MWIGIEPMSGQERSNVVHQNTLGRRRWGGVGPNRRTVRVLLVFTKIGNAIDTRLLYSGRRCVVKKRTPL